MALFGEFFRGLPIEHLRRLLASPDRVAVRRLDLPTERSRAPRREVYLSSSKVQALTGASRTTKSVISGTLRAQLTAQTGALSRFVAQSTAQIGALERS